MNLSTRENPPVLPSRLKILRSVAESLSLFTDLPYHLIHGFRGSSNRYGLITFVVEYQF